MKSPFDVGGAQAVYDFWLGLIPQFLGQLGAGMQGAEKTGGAHATAGPAALKFWGAAMGPEAMQNLTRAYEPMLRAADPSAWLGRWAAAMPTFPMAQAATGEGGASAPNAGSMFGPWAAMFTPPAGSAAKHDAGSQAANPMHLFAPWMAATPVMRGVPGADAGSGAATAGMQSLQAAQQSWFDSMARMSGTSSQGVVAFDRTFGGLFDALGFGPMRKLRAACEELASASLAQNQARATYGMLVQGAFSAGLERLMARLAKMADEGERVESVLALLRLWAVSTEEAVHEVLQSEKGLAATAALARAGVTSRRKLQNVAGIVADSLDMATRRELDEAYREIHNLKRELRALRAPAPTKAVAPRKPRGRTVKKRKTK